jgi:hypothetical protein
VICAFNVSLTPTIWARWAESVRRCQADGLFFFEAVSPRYHRRRFKQPIFHEHEPSLVKPMVQFLDRHGLNWIARRGRASSTDPRLARCSSAGGRRLVEASANSCRH